MNLTNPIFNNEDAAREHLESLRWAFPSLRAITIVAIAAINSLSALARFMSVPTLPCINGY
jgi:hypothetical protein